MKLERNGSKICLVFSRSSNEKRKNACMPTINLFLIYKQKHMKFGNISKRKRRKPLKWLFQKISHIFDTLKKLKKT